MQVSFQRPNLSNKNKNFWEIKGIIKGNRRLVIFFTILLPDFQLLLIFLALINIYR